MGKLFNLFYYQRLVDVDKLIKEFADITLKELNYLQEVKNVQFFYEHYQNHPVVYIPKTYADLCTNNVIVQEYIGGVSMIDLIRMKLNKVDIDKWLAQNLHTDKRFVIKYLYYDTFRQGFDLNTFYSDFHPGNIKILANNRYSLIDFGIISQVPGNKRSLYEVLKMLSQKKMADIDVQSFSKEFLKMGSVYLYKCLQLYDSYYENQDNLGLKVTDNYRHIVENHKEEFRQLEHVYGENFSQIFFDMFKLGQRFNMRFSPKMFSVVRATAMIKSFTEILDPQFRCMREIFEKVTQDVDGRELINEEEIRLNNLQPEEATESLMNWIAEMNKLRYICDIDRNELLCQSLPNV